MAKKAGTVCAAHARLQVSPVIGILGSGQLGRMLALAAARLGMKSGIYAPEPGPASEVSDFCVAAPYDNKKALADFIKQVDVMTFEFENIPVNTVAFLENLGTVHPSCNVLKTTQDRFLEKRFLQNLGIAVAPFASVATVEDVLAVGLPAVIKTRRFGYDGHGQKQVKSRADAQKVFFDQKTPMIAEAHINFDQEISVILARAQDGTVCMYDVVENIHKNGILRRSQVPAQISKKTAVTAQKIAAHIATHLQYVGVLAVEFFVEKNTVLVNEIAPRVHNSGHWTLDACKTSQFEQHIRAICGWPLGDCERHADAVMTNILGQKKPKKGIVHWYGKTEARPGRKMGHATCLFPKSDVITSKP